MKSSEIRDEAMTDNGCKTVSIASMKDTSDSSAGCEPCTGDYPCSGCSAAWIFEPCITCVSYKTPTDITNCICSSDNCNTSDIVKPIMPHLAQIFTILIYSTLFRLGM